MTHTPGPWLINFDPEDDERPLEIVTSDRDHRIAFLASDGNPDDARLISAAPTLLALLRETALYMGEPTRGTPARNELIRTIRAAIAKAEGREP